MGSGPFALILRQLHGKGPALAGALFVCGCARQSALHDTYYVVARGNYLLWMIAETLAVLLAWWVVFRLSPNPPHRLRMIVLMTYGAGIFLVLASLPLWALFKAENFLTLINAANRMSVLGAAIIFAATVATAAVLIWAVIGWLLRRL